MTPGKPPLLDPEGSGLPRGSQLLFKAPLLKTWEIKTTGCFRATWHTRGTDPLWSQMFRVQKLFQIFDLSNNSKGKLSVLVVSLGPAKCPREAADEGKQAIGHSANG